VRLIFGLEVQDGDADMVDKILQLLGFQSDGTRQVRIPRRR
jgi:hypothetical protein